MGKKDLTLSSKILMTLLAMGEMFVITPSSLKKSFWNGKLLGDEKNFARIAYYLYKKGLIKYVNKQNSRFYKLTKEGQLEALLLKAKINQRKEKWDGKWRLVSFDIPEESREKRDLFRALLKCNGFRQLQASLYISPYTLNRESLDYLKKTKLIEFIRIMKVEEMDFDRDLRKKFKLNK